MKLDKKLGPTFIFEENETLTHFFLLQL